jgi:hypothetical protein
VPFLQAQPIVRYPIHFDAASIGTDGKVSLLFCLPSVWMNIRVSARRQDAFVEIVSHSSSVCYYKPSGLLDDSDIMNRIDTGQDEIICVQLG